MNEYGRLIKLGFAVTAITGNFLHLYERLADHSLRQTFPITEHIGNISFGLNAVYAGKILAAALRGTGVMEPKYSKTVSLATAGVIFGLMLLNETIGLGGGTPDIKDVPALALGVLGAASFLELTNKS